MSNTLFNRRDALKAGTTTFAALVAQMSMPEFLFANQQNDEELVPFLNMPRSRRQMLDWETLDSWITPQDQVFDVAHYPAPDVKEDGYKLEISFSNWAAIRLRHSR